MFLLRKVSFGICFTSSVVMRKGIYRGKCSLTRCIKTIITFYTITRQDTFAQFFFFLKIGFIMHEKSSTRMMGRDVGGKYLQDDSSYHDPVKLSSVNKI